MPTKGYLTLLLLLALSQHSAFSQGYSKPRNKSLKVISDTLTVDSLSLVPGTAQVFDKNRQLLDSSCYTLDWVNSQLIFHQGKTCITDSVFVRYRVMSFLLGETYQHKDPLRLKQKGEPKANPFYYQPTTDSRFTLFPEKGLAANGSLSRGISFGNNQDVFVNSSLNLQLAGKLGDGIELLAAITDENIPIQPEGNTQQLQEFDRVFIQLSKDKSKLIAGDFELRRPDSYFMNFFKRGQGAFAATSVSLVDSTKVRKTRIMNAAASAAIAKGKFARKVFQGVEGNQGPYRLSGNDNENFIVVLSGTEKVFIDGQLLTRGMQYDYVIDYNTAEITFMPKRLITKDIRIIVEFEYTDRNYVRSMLYFNNEFVTDKVKLKLNVYSEQDSKNQPLLQELDSAQKSVMADVGDQIDEAYFNTADSLSEFDASLVLYQKVDTITTNGTFAGVFVYSTDPLNARWNVSFSDVGQGNGDYVQDVRSANGRVFKWVEPINGISQGNFRPVQLLITPKQRRMITLGSDIHLQPNKKLFVETAWSDNDINLYSTQDKSNDHGIAARLRYDQRVALSADTIDGWKLNSRFDYEYAARNFRSLEPYRPAEFVRDWNVSGNTFTADENIISAEAGFSKSKIGTAGYQLKTYQRGAEYSGWSNGLFSDVTYRNFNLRGTGSYLTTRTALQNTTFSRHQFDFSKQLGKIILGIKDNAETNRFFNSVNDSLQSNTYAWQEWVGYISFRDSLKNSGTLSFKNRRDRGPRGNTLVASANAREVAATAELLKNPKNTFRNTTTYRDLVVLDSVLITTPPLQTLVNRMDHQLTLWKGVITAVTYYEISSGRDRKQEFYYLEVPAGQGSYAYIGDLNGNNVQDLNEFAIANFTDQAKYIRVYFNSDEYIFTRSNSFSEVLNINPAAGVNDRSKLRFFHRFTDQFLLRLDKKTTGEEVLSALNPFSLNLSDSILVSTNSSYRNTVFFNRSDPKYGADYTWQQNQNKVLLVTGFDYRQLKAHLLTVRWNMTREWQLTVSYEEQEQLNSSEFFPDRNYMINATIWEPKVVYQPNNAFRIITGYRHANKINQEGGAEELIENKLSIETRWNSINSGSLTTRFNYIRLDYNGELNSFVAYELLGGLTPGTNYTWNISLLKNITNIIQVNLSYEGRKGENTRAIHTGNVQFRAFF